MPLGSPVTLGEREGMGSPYAGEGWRSHFGDQEISQFRGAELIAEKWGISRQAMERYALASHQRALAAQAGGVFADEIAPAFGLEADEGPRADTSLEKMAGLKPLTEGGRLTAAVSSQISDGAAALLVASEEAVRRLGLAPLARVHTMTWWRSTRHSHRWSRPGWRRPAPTRNAPMPSVAPSPWAIRWVPPAPG
ncbi:acetyl-CoA acetyltransferase [Streptomyces rapamycinicus]|uniref:Acetyl-CoA acetyltransferase n=2 Tax=Streptomyces rapamycinicus TaxID=1226757 RepID=A0A3L8RCF8_STRRN|nr:acetyl-CoA acetyltransferase [Streptomyces rapamycinicus]RLV77240.1 acetyl-CoA acetyltransferase [Streptomyces rapamycinicus NRRL 5491]